MGPDPAPSSIIESLRRSIRDLPGRTGPEIGTDAFDTLKRALDRIELAALPFKGLVVDRLAALPKLASGLAQSVEAGDYGEVAALAQALAEATMVLADGLVGVAVELVRLTSNLEKAVKAGDRQLARDLALQLEPGVKEFDRALEQRKQDAVRAGAMLARAALAKEFDTVATIAPPLGRDATIIACTRGNAPAIEVRAFAPTGALGDRAMRLQQSLITQDYVSIAQLASEATIQAGIMADPTVTVAVALIAEARSVRKAAGAGSSAALRDLTTKLVQSAPLLTGRLAERTGDLKVQAAEILTALAHKDYASAAVLGWRIALAAQIAQHGIVSRATSLVTVTSALRDAAFQGETETITTLLEGV